MAPAVAKRDEGSTNFGGSRWKYTHELSMRVGIVTEEVDIPRRAMPEKDACERRTAAQMEGDSALARPQELQHWIGHDASVEATLHARSSVATQPSCRATTPTFRGSYRGVARPIANRVGLRRHS
jgi:hypothetical protein